MKHFGRLLAIGLSLSLAFPATLPVLASGADASEVQATTEQNGLYEIQDGKATINGEEYVAISTAAELGKMEKNKNYILANDIDCTGLDAPKGYLFDFPGENNNDSTAKTVLNGNGFALININITSGAAAVGIFNGADKKGINGIIIRNLSIGTADAHAKITSTASGAYVGGVVGYVNSAATFENVTVWADITSANGKTGGILGGIRWGDGKNWSITLTDCVFGGFIVSSTTPEEGDHGCGMIGNVMAGANTIYTIRMTRCVNNASMSKMFTYGGMIGYMKGNNNAVALVDCVNNGELTAAAGKWGSKVGGMIGQLSMTPAAYVRLEGCVNTGRITAKAKCAGGMIGEFAGYATEFVLRGCVNYGAVDCQDTVRDGRSGGLIGSLSLTKASYPLTVEDCRNYGSVGSTKNVGALIGLSDQGNARISIKNALNFGAMTATDGSGKDAVVVSNSGVVTAENVKDFSDKTGAELLAAVNADAEVTDAFGLFKLDDTGLAIPATPVLKGFQTRKASDTSIDLRLVATIGNTLDYRQVGFRIALGDNAAKVHGCTKVYKTLNATVDGAMSEYTAESLGGTYLYALTVQSIPVQETPIVLTVTAYALDADATTEYTLTSYTVTVTNGVVTIA
mgnify:CR=1 FL=1